MPKRILTFVIIVFALGVATLLLSGSSAHTRIIEVLSEILPGGSEETKTRISKNTPIQMQLTALLGDFETDPEDIEFDTLSGDTSLVVRARIPRGVPIEIISSRLTRALKRSSHSVIDAEYDDRKDICRLTLRSSLREPRNVSVILSRSSTFFSKTAQMAVVIEDFSFSADETTVEILSFEHPLTLVLSSEHRRSSLSAQIAGEYKKEIVLALPLEPHIRPQGFPIDRAIMVHHTPEHIRHTLHQAMDAAPHFSGFTNIEGSRVLEDSRVIRILLEETKKRHGYILEHRVTPRSLLPTYATKMGVPHARIYRRIDSGLSPDEIGARLQHLAVVAQTHGRIVISLPFTSESIEGLQAKLEILGQNGIQLVYVSDIVLQPPR